MDEDDYVVSERDLKGDMVLCIEISSDAFGVKRLEELVGGSVSALGGIK
jgi:hypothetical protein